MALRCGAPHPGCWKLPGYMGMGILRTGVLGYHLVNRGVYMVLGSSSEGEVNSGPI